jgi:hypothetical protein
MSDFAGDRFTRTPLRAYSTASERATSHRLGPWFAPLRSGDRRDRAYSNASRTGAVSVDHPDTVENYRIAHAVRQRSETEQASTEDLRDALLRYRSLFDELLRPEGNGAADGTIQPADASSRQRVTAGPESQDPGISATGQTDRSAAMGSDGTGPADPDPDYHDQRTGRREGR